MADDHSHHHHAHNVVLTSVNTAFVTGIVLNLAFVLIEAITGFYLGSLSLLSDAGHNLADVGSLALSLLAFRLLKVKPNENYTYGYRKTTILSALFNGVVLLVSIGAISYEAIRRLFHPQPIEGNLIAIIAGVGIVVNGVTALFFFRNKDKDLNLKSAYLHLLADAAVSAALVIGGLLIVATGWYWLDPALSLLVAFVIFFSTWNLFRDSLRLSLDGVPKNIDLKKVKEEAMKVKGIRDIYHIHVWAISTTENAMTAHLKLDPAVTYETEAQIKETLRHAMLHMNILHVTLETAKQDISPATKTCVNTVMH